MSTSELLQGLTDEDLIALAEHYLHSSQWQEDRKKLGEESLKNGDN